MRVIPNRFAGALAAFLFYRDDQGFHSLVFSPVGEATALRDVVGGSGAATVRELVAGSWQTLVTARPIWLGGPLPLAAALPVEQSLQRSPSVSARLGSVSPSPVVPVVPTRLSTRPLRSASSTPSSMPCDRFARAAPRSTPPSHRDRSSVTPL